jgi:outer membrane protein assembly factor BamB
VERETSSTFIQTRMSKPMLRFALTLCQVALPGIFVLTVSAQKTPKRTWQTKPSYFQAPYAPATYLHELGQDAFFYMSGPLGVELFDAGNGKPKAGATTVMKKQASRGTSVRLLTGDGSGVTVSGCKKCPPAYDVDLKGMVNVHHVKLPGHSAVLRFDMSDNGGMGRESIAMVDLNTGSVLWERKDLSWSLFNLKWLLEWLGQKTGSGSEAASLTLLGVNDLVQYPAKYIETLVTFVPGQDLALINSFTGLVCLDLNTGGTRWTVAETSKGLSGVHFVEGTNTAVTIGGNPAWMPRVPLLSKVFSLSKDVIHIDLADGKILWQTKFKSAFREKQAGGFQRSPWVADIRVRDNMVLCNFNRLEVFDLTTGDALLQTTTGKDGGMAFLAEVPQRFAPPVVHDGKLYRTVITTILAAGASVGRNDPNNIRVSVEAYDIASGSLDWTSQEFNRTQIKTMDLVDGTLYVGFDGKEGIKALDARTGKVLWECPLGSRGVTTQWILDGDKIIAVERGTIHTVDRRTGAKTWSTDLFKLTGHIAEITLVGDRILVEGERKGIAFCSKADGALQCHARTGFDAIVHMDTDEVVVLPVNAADAFMILRTQDLGLKAGMKASKKRTSMLWMPSTRSVYCVESGWLRGYPMGG